MKTMQVVHILLDLIGLGSIIGRLAIEQELRRGEQAGRKKGGKARMGGQKSSSDILIGFARIPTISNE